MSLHKDSKEDFPSARVGRHADNNDQKFKKEYQVVDRPAVTDHDINDEYFRNPPNNEPTEPITSRKAPGLKEGAREETDLKVDGVLGDQPTSRILPDVARSNVVQENSVHSNVEGVDQIGP
ncbi:hypothetical protein CERSUDRAFT_122173 [Gelatoporia subvermispora B]|uniref:Uncharacterized protein n=1 Tax=Ceriporiopsis subvermispora (strain B) TaxID=914234 RepID=M2RMK4_CERS8|nr:hypothetical protein CERSUDRAFT_122173 [Gelatoporia subvermispora B]